MTYQLSHKDQGWQPGLLALVVKGSRLWVPPPGFEIRPLRNSHAEPQRPKPKTVRGEPHGDALVASLLASVSSLDHHGAARTLDYQKKKKKKKKNKKKSKYFLIKSIFFTFINLFLKILLVFWKKIYLSDFLKKNNNLEIKIVFCSKIHDTIEPALHRVLINTYLIV